MNESRLTNTLYMNESRLTNSHMYPTMKSNATATNSCIHRRKTFQVIFTHMNESCLTNSHTYPRKRSDAAAANSRIYGGAAAEDVKVHGVWKCTMSSFWLCVASACMWVMSCMCVSHDAHTLRERCVMTGESCYGVATVSRINKIIGLFWRILSLL